MVEMTFGQFRVLKSALDRELGIIEQIAPQGILSCEAPSHYGVSVAQNPTAISPHSRHAPGARPDRQAAGAGASWKEALWSTLGETLERYSAAIIDPASIRTCRQNDLEGQVASPADMIRFSREQYDREDFPYLDFTPDSVIDWTLGVRAIDGADAWLPADYVWIAHTGGNKARLDRGYSTGLGAHTDIYRAANTAIKELLERDAYLSRYLLMAPPSRQPRAQTLEMLPDEIADYLSDSNFDLRVYDITSQFGIPVALCHILFDHGIGIASGASCQGNPRDAVRKAVQESLHTANWLVDMNRWDLDTEREDIDEFIDHVIFHRRPDAAANYRRFLSGEESVDCFNVEPLDDDPRAEFATLVQRLEAAGFPVFLADLTSCDIRDLGFNVIRAVIPGLQPMYAGIDSLHGDARRLEQVAEWLGLERDEIRAEHEPHPFP